MTKYAADRDFTKSPRRDGPLRRTLLSSTSRIAALVAALGLAGSGLGATAATPSAESTPERPSVQEALQLAQAERLRGKRMHKVQPRLKRTQLVPLRKLRKPRNVQLRGNLNKKVSPAVMRSMNRIAAEFSRMPDDAANAAFSLHLDFSSNSRLADRAQRKMTIR